MTAKKSKIIVWIAFVVLPLALHTAESFVYAYGGYDGEHCAGLLDAVWECTEFEYYLNWIFNPFTLLNLFGFYLAALPFAIAATMAINRKKLSDQNQT
ncbi:hypothetical protein [Candidatus Electronema sp. JC]|uniref:hypothetical protein n=1 Tax=Candidatus Electronema sp. JC TaxID=3401570 RepID=UPI003B43A43D